jgi:hypothetical protein
MNMRQGVLKRSIFTRKEIQKRSGWQLFGIDGVLSFKKATLKSGFFTIGVNNTQVCITINFSKNVIMVISDLSPGSVRSENYYCK